MEGSFSGSNSPSVNGKSLQEYIVTTSNGYMHSFGRSVIPDTMPFQQHNFTTMAMPGELHENLDVLAIPGNSSCLFDVLRAPLPSNFSVVYGDGDRLQPLPDNRNLQPISPGSRHASGSRFLKVIQGILDQIAKFALMNIDPVCFTNHAGVSNYHNQSRIEDELGSSKALELKKRDLLALLEAVDDGYTKFVDEMHTVISAFHAATELDPQLHTRCVRQTVGLMYRNLRERISNQILSMGEHSRTIHAESEVQSEITLLQKQWLKRKDHHLWRPQRGLPEKAVSVLRAWMFQNFLHPYPKDSEKHLLAIRSGLTRSQVSNWFINARVRLWKPMIEEMYADMHKRKAILHQKEEESITFSSR